MAAQKKDSSGGVKGLLDNKEPYTFTVVYVDGAPFQQQREQEKINKQIKADLQVAVDERKNSKFLTVPFDKLDFGETSVLETFSNADVAIVDMTSKGQASLSYHVGVRHSLGMKDNFMLFRDENPEETISMKLSCTGYMFFPYSVDCNGTIYITDVNGLLPDPENVTSKSTAKMTFLNRLKKALQEVDVNTSKNRKDKFLADLRKAKESLSDDIPALRKKLLSMRNRIDHPQLIQADVVYNLLLAYRDIQDYDAMVKFVEDINAVPNKTAATDTIAIQHQYAFALNRRNEPGDRDKALVVIKRVAEQMGGRNIQDVVCLCGRIYKDKFNESNYQDIEARDEAIKWYREGFELQANVYAGINLATMLVISGKDFSTDRELQRIGCSLNNLIGRKGSLTQLQDYWDVATYFEISVLAEDYPKAIQAAECMFKLQPPIWYLKSTLGNIQLINYFRNKNPEQDDDTSLESNLFHFWMEFFMEAIKDEDTSCVRFPVLVLEPTKLYTTSYVQINADDEPPTIKVWHVQQDSNQWCFERQHIKGVSLYKRDARAIFLYVQQNSDDFHIFFPSELKRKGFYEAVLNMCEIDNDEGAIRTDFVMDSAETCNIQYEYELDDKGHRIILGKGSYGVVVAARDTNTQIKIAIKEIPEQTIEDVQPLQEEIRLHANLTHRNIVRYMGSTVDGGYLKIFMEQVPGGSLTQLLRNKWGPLKDNELSMVMYTKQILDGLKYLHDNQIVHRDIKGDNVLVNTYNGVVKISDFGTSKRLSGLKNKLSTFAGTPQYMAPEVITNGRRGYSAPADIWSLGCTVVEMATGQPPFVELEPPAALFKVGMFHSHPEIPESLSDVAKDFILKCFEPTAARRPSAQALLEHPFVNRKKARKVLENRNKLHKDNGVYERSVSVPALGAQTVSSPVTSPETRAHNKLRVVLPPTNPNLRAVNRHASEGTERSISTFAQTTHHSRSVSPCRSMTAPSWPTSSSSVMDYDTHPNTPGTPKDYLTSPPVDSAASFEVRGDRSGESGGLFMLKKDQESRAKLIEILTEDAAKLSEIWAEDQKANQKNCLSDFQMHNLAKAMREFIHTQESTNLDNYLKELLTVVQYGSMTMEELHRSIYSLNEASMKILKERQMPPHWMFAFDGFLKTTIKHSIEFLTPDLRSDDSIDEELTPPPLLSSISLMSGDMSEGAPISKYRRDIQRLQEEYTRSQEDTYRILQELQTVDRNYQQLLKGVLRERKSQVQCLTDAIAMPPPNSLPMGSSIYGADSPPQSTNMSTSEPESPDLNHITIPHLSLQQPTADSKLVKWLESLNCDRTTISRFATEEYTFSDVMELISREDLRRMNLRGGVECRIWREILQVRHTGNHTSVCANTMDSE
ncbi:mitogen-activated protein kinase kinase kinase 15-like isoform X2 [Watersipora subatra]|uniref:mitogen-activated protein kinase kinase kinase 15-like isoform X2 n=1 Tax=Watersipora subatra TaxID=2589382 RepID=UPI00355B3C3D